MSQSIQSQSPTPSGGSSEPARSGPSGKSTLRELTDFMDKYMKVNVAWHEVPMHSLQWDQFHASPASDQFKRFDYVPAEGTFVLRRPSRELRAFEHLMIQDVQRRVDLCSRDLFARGNSLAWSFAMKTFHLGSQPIVFVSQFKKAENLEDAWQLRRPDVQFGTLNARYPGLLFEFAYAGDGKDLARLAKDYIWHSEGEVNIVIGITMDMNSQEASLSVWRSAYDCDATQVYSEDTFLSVIFDQKPFRSASGSLVNGREYIGLNLSDFGDGSWESEWGTPSDLSIPFSSLYHALERSEQGLNGGLVELALFQQNEMEGFLSDKALLQPSLDYELPSTDPVEADSNHRGRDPRSRERSMEPPTKRRRFASPDTMCDADRSGSCDAEFGTTADDAIITDDDTIAGDPACIDTMDDDTTCVDPACNDTIENKLTSVELAMCLIKEMLNEMPMEQVSPPNVEMEMDTDNQGDYDE